MPKLDNTHLSRRIAEQIKRLEEGHDVIVRDVKAVLSVASLAQVEKEWQVQQQLRKGKRPRNDEERAALGFLTKRDIYLAALKGALAQADGDSSAVWKKKLQDAKIKQTRIYFDALKEAEKAGKSKASAQSWANNELTRNGLRRMDGADSGYNDKRDREVNELEDKLREQLMTAEDKEYERQMAAQSALDAKTRKRAVSKPKRTKST